MSADAAESASSRSLQSWIVRLLGIDLDRRHEIYLDVASSASLRSGTYWLEILFSAGIATLGLTLDSPAVIIGAMLISPLMGPILAMGLALAAGDILLALRSLTSLFLSAALAIGFATLLVVFLPFREMTAEIAARTHPNTLDLFIALFSGAIGSIATCKNVRGVATSIPGVAIAVALMPPLCVVGYGVGLIFTVDRIQGGNVVRGGGLLFLTNLVAITFTAMLVFLILQIGDAAVRERVRGRETVQTFFGRTLPPALVGLGSLPGRLLLVAFLVALLVVPLSRSLDSLKREIAQQRSESHLQKETLELWNQTFGRAATGKIRSYVDSVTTEESGGRLAVHLRLFTNEPYSDEERAEFVRRLAHALRRSPGSIDLSLVEIPTSQYDATMREKSRQMAPPVASPPPPPPTIPEVIANARKRIDESVASVHLPMPALIDTMAVTLTGGTRLDVFYVSPRDIDVDGQALLSDEFRNALGDPAIAVSFHRIDSDVDVRFRKNAVSLDAGSTAKLHSLAEAVARHPEWTIVIRPPARDRNQPERMRSIRAQLGAVDPARITVGEAGSTAGYGISIVIPAPKSDAPPAAGARDVSPG